MLYIDKICEEQDNKAAEMARCKFWSLQSRLDSHISLEPHLLHFLLSSKISQLHYKTLKMAVTSSSDCSLKCTKGVLSCEKFFFTAFCCLYSLTSFPLVVELGPQKLRNLS